MEKKEAYEYSSSDKSALSDTNLFMYANSEELGQFVQYNWAMLWDHNYTD